MNQILSTELKQNKKSFEKKNWFKFQFAFSILIVVLLTFCGASYLYYLQKKEDFSKSLIANYNIYRLYNVQENNSNTELVNGLFGIIEIEKINLYYPVFSQLTEDLLKISPCKFYGDMPNDNGNICIAGHNYDNSLFFSKISTLSIDDKISIFDNAGTQYVYFVYDIYEVSESDLSPVLDYDDTEKTLTLVTCNNLNSNRIILKAKQKKLLQ
ncbi:MAG: sortase [Clostridia bacterium]|nr:sortase [Clostridia bacterium]